MTLQAVKAGAFIPDPYLIVSGYNTTWAISSSAHKFVMNITVPKSGNINKVGFRTGTVTSSQTLKISLQTIDATGTPSGTLYGGSAAGTQGSPASDTYYEVTLGTAAAASAGDHIAIVIEFNATVGNLQLSTFSTSGMAFPFVNYYTTAWAPNYYILCGSLGYDDSTYEPVFGMYPVSSIEQLIYNTASTPDEYANRFSFPYAHAVNGIWVVGDFDRSADLVLYDSNDNVLTSNPIKQAERGTQASGRTIVSISPQTFSANEVYRIAIRPTTSSNPSQGFVYQYTVPSAAMMDCFAGGTGIYSCYRTDDGSWTATPTKRLTLGVIQCQFSDDIGGGPKIASPLTGGTR